MKKALMVLLVLFTSFLIPNYKVSALSDSFYVGEYLTGEYIVKINESSGKYEQMRAFRRKSDNRVAYCLELWEGINENKNLTGYNDKQYDYANIDYSDWEKVLLISYYGYGYNNHTDNKWIAITQFMIWKTLSPESTIYFTDTLNGKRITKYESEMNEIKELINKHQGVPSFSSKTYQIKYNEDFQITDDNNILDRFDITSNAINIVSKVGNNITVNINKPGLHVLCLTNKDKKYSNNPIIYIDPNGQDLLIAGSYYPIYSVVRFNLPSSTIKITKLDKETNSVVPQGDASLKGSFIQLIDKSNNVISEKEINNDSELTFENVAYGSYYLKEIKPGNGYLLNNNLIELEVNNELQNVSFYNEVIKEKVVFKKYTRNTITNETNLEQDASFSIYNSNNEKITTFKTDKNGTYELILPYGNYTLKQENGKKNHLYIKDISISINNNGNTQYFNLYNDEITSLIKIINTDSDSNLPILESGAKFKIKKINDDINTLVTNTLGETDSIILSSGKYTIEQISSTNNYEINKDIFEFEIDENTTFVKIDNNNLLEIVIPNNKLKSKIEVNKITEYYLNDILIKTETNKLEDILIYASEDIYTKDGIKVYEKDKVVTSDLYYGNYYIINPVTNSKIELVIDTPNTRKVDIIEKVYEYKENIEKDIEENTEKQESENTKECEKEETGEEIKEETITNVPNTYKKTNISYISSLLIILGFIINKKENKNENN